MQLRKTAKVEKTGPAFQVVDVPIEDVKPGMVMLHKKTRQKVTVNYVQKHKVNYRADTGDYSMEPDHFVQTYGLRG